MTVFQAYCISSEDSAIWRFVLTFPDYTVADAWWRAISNIPVVGPSLTRLEPQFYTQTPSVFNVYDFYTDPRTKSIASNFKGLFFMTMIDDRSGRNVPIVQSLKVANAISGEYFFIRSVSKPPFYWFFDQSVPGNNLTGSIIGRTRFRIAAVDPNLDGKVLIDTDQVTLQLEYSSMYIALNNAKDLFVYKSPYKFTLGELMYQIGYNQYFGTGLLKDESGEGTNTNGAVWTWELSN